MGLIKVPKIDPSRNPVALVLLIIQAQFTFFSHSHQVSFSKAKWLAMGKSLLSQVGSEERKHAWFPVLGSED